MFSEAALTWIQQVYQAVNLLTFLVYCRPLSNDQVLNTKPSCRKIKQDDSFRAEKDWGLQRTGPGPSIHSAARREDIAHE